ncbi:tyrosine-type recombinase/integrase [Planotetraspora thailandica]|uniref:tyrosine-type recombinase/integrase n=1 Tax=Planotetraspora thailandica TaxID=487172 RepID=UPI0035709C27
MTRPPARELVFAPPKGGKIREVPLPETVALRLSAHIAAFPPVEIRLPWKTPEAQQHTAQLVFTTRRQTVIVRHEFNRFAWKTALAKVGIQMTRENGFHMLRHHFASVLMEDGVSIEAVAELLGRTDPGFTLQTYTSHRSDALAECAGHAGVRVAGARPSTASRSVRCSCRVPRRWMTSSPDSHSARETRSEKARFAWWAVLGSNQ